MAIIVDHVAFAPSLLFLLTGGGLMFASPAEGFFVISGILVGYLYGPKILTQTKAVCKKIWKRAGLLYLLSVGLTLLFTVWALLLPDARVPLQPWTGDIGKFIINTLTLRYAYGWTDFLPRYALFMLAAPAMLWLLAKGKWWLLIIGSAAGWFFLRDFVYFQPFSAWQLLFVAGVTIGYYLPQIEAWVRRRGRVIVKPVVGLAVTTFAISIATLVIPHLAGAPLQIPAEVRAYFDKGTLEVGRLILGTIWFAGLYMVIRRYEHRIARRTRGVLQVFGEKSLLTYCLHGVVLFAISSIIYPIHNGNLITNTASTVLVLAFMYLLISVLPHIMARMKAIRFRSLFLSRKPEIADVPAE